MNRRADPFYRFSAEGLLAASDAHDSRNPADKDVLPIHAEEFVDPFFPALLGVAEWASKHVTSLKL